jgi:uncharacterized protein YodC (DUF2158 family)
MQSKFKCGDVVIKQTGGNKMTIYRFIDGLYECVWFVESSLNNKLFSEDDIIPIDDYKRFLLKEERADKINQILQYETRCI